MEENVLEIYNNSGHKVDENDMKLCHPLHLSRKSKGINKCVIIKSVNWKYPKMLLNRVSVKI